MSIGNIADRRREFSVSAPLLATCACGLVIALGLLTWLLASGKGALVWPVTGVAAGALAIVPLKRRPLVAAGLAAGLLALAIASDVGFGRGLAFAGLGVAEAWLVVWALEYFAGRRPSFNRVGTVALLIALAVVVPVLIGWLSTFAFSAAGAEKLGADARWTTWWCTHGLGLLTFTPVMLQFAPETDWRHSFRMESVIAPVATAMLAAIIGGPLVVETSVVMLAAVLLAIAGLWLLLRRITVFEAACSVASMCLVAIWTDARSAGLLSSNPAVGTPLVALVAVAFLLAGAWHDEAKTDLSLAAVQRASGSTDTRRAWFLLIPVMLFATFAWWAWRGAMREAEQRVVQVVGALSAHAQRVIEAQEGMLSAVLSGVEGRTPESVEQDRHVHELLRSLERSSTMCLAMGIVRTDTGKLVSTSTRFPAPDVSASHRDFVTQLRASPSATVVGATIIAEASGIMGFTVSRTEEKGPLAIVALVDRGEFQTLYASQGNDPSDSLLLFRKDGSILASYPELETPLNERLAASAPQMRLIATGNAQPTRALGADGIERLYAVRTIPRYALSVAYGLSTSILLRDWLGQLVPFAFVNFVAALVLWLLAGRVAAATRIAEMARAEAKVERALKETVRASEARLRQSEEASTRLAAIVTSSSDAIISKTLEGIITSWNRGAETMFGYSQEEMVGQSIRRLIPHDRQHEEDAFLAKLAGGEPIHHYETLRVRKDGKVIDVSITISPLLGRDQSITGAASIVREVSERKAAEAALAESEERFRGIFDHAGTGIAIANYDGHLAQCNPAYAAMLGYTQDELIGCYAPDRIHPDDRAANREQLKRLTSGEIDSYEIVDRSLRKDGSIVWLHKHISTLRSRDGWPTHLIALVTDMTEQRRSEERQRMLVRELAHRGKNLLAVIQSIANRSFSGQTTLAEARSSFQGRMQALARTYETLTDESLDGAELEQLVRGELDAFEGRAQIDGPSIRLTSRSAQTMALIVHELATNAAKYGALSVSGGVVDVRWEVRRDNDGPPSFEFVWSERGGPPAVEPERRGFGSALVSSVAGAEFRCKPELNYGPTGFSYRFAARLAAIGSSNGDRLPVRERIKARTMLALYDKWLADKRSGPQLPNLGQFTTSRKLADGHVTLVEVSPTGECRILDDDGPMRDTDGEAPPDGMPTRDDASAMRAYLRCARAQTAQYEHTHIDGSDGRPVSFERLMVPYLSPDGETIVIVVLTSLEEDEPAWAAG